MCGKPSTLALEKAIHLVKAFEDGIFISLF